MASASGALRVACHRLTTRVEIFDILVAGGSVRAPGYGTDQLEGFPLLGPPRQPVMQAILAIRVCRIRIKSRVINNNNAGALPFVLATKNLPKTLTQLT